MAGEGIEGYHDFLYIQVPSQEQALGVRILIVRAIYFTGHPWISNILNVSRVIVEVFHLDQFLTYTTITNDRITRTTFKVGGYVAISMVVIY